MPDPQTPTEEQVKASNEAEMERWKDDFEEESLKIPYKHEEVEQKTPDPVKEDTEVVEDEEFSEPKSVVTTEDPGDYVAADYSFEVTDKDGKKVTISTPEDADKFADDDDNFKTARELRDFLSKAQKMEIKSERDYDKWETQKKEFESESKVETERLQTVQSLVSGFEYLISKGFLPEVSAEDTKANWQDPEVAKHPGVKEQIELINYMTKENAAREKAGVPVLGSALDAYNAFRLDKDRKEEERSNKAAGQARKAASARVAAVSASNQAPYIPKGIAVGNPNAFKRNQSIWDN